MWFVGARRKSLSHLSVEDIPHRVESILIDLVLEISFNSSPSEWMWMQERNSIMGCKKGSLKKINFKRKPCRWSCTQGSFPCHCGKAPWSKPVKTGKYKFCYLLNARVYFNQTFQKKWSPLLGDCKTKACQPLLWHHHVKLFKAVQRRDTYYQLQFPREKKSHLSDTSPSASPSWSTTAVTITWQVSECLVKILTLSLITKIT